MTIGGWCLGNAWLAFSTARRREWRLIFPACLYLWLFGLFELGVLFTFRAKLVLAGPLAWGYLAALLASTAAALIGFLEWRRTPVQPAPPAEALPRAQTGNVIFFIFFVGLLGLYGLLAPQGAPGTNGGIFPEVMSPFTLRSFGAFYLALALAVVPLLRLGLAALRQHAFASYGLIVFITIAAFVYLPLFDFTHRPGGLAYFGAYLAVGIVTGMDLLKAAAASPAPTPRTGGSTGA
jgi:hypothetical protein